MKRRLLMLLFFAALCLPLSIYAASPPAAKSEVTMRSYVVFLSFTAQGIQNIKDSPARFQAAKETVRRLGGEVKGFYGLLGSQFDTILIVEAPNDEAVSKMVLAIASAGDFRTETHPLFSEDEYRKIISGLP